jgi:hypothetical protein
MPFDTPSRIQIGMGSLLTGLLGIGPGGRVAVNAGLDWPIGGFLGYWFVTFFVAWIATNVGRGNFRIPAVGVGGILRDRWVWLLTLLGVAAGATYGTRFGPSIGESAQVGAVALGVMGAGPGFAFGLLVAWSRRRSRANAALEVARDRYVESLNTRASRGMRFSIDGSDRRALVVDHSNDINLAADPGLRERVREGIERIFDEDINSTAAELRLHGFDKWIVKLNGEPVLERPIPNT